MSNDSIPKPLGGLSGRLAEHWLDLLFSPVLTFWVLGAWLALPPTRWAELDKALAAGPNLRQALLMAVALLGVMLCAAVARHLRFATLRLLEGYWPKLLDYPRRWLSQGMAKRLERQQTEFQKLAAKGLDALDRQQLADFLRLDAALMQAPADPRQLMPTRLGNLLRAAELAPRDRYGLDGVICWPRLWLLLPENVRAELAQARETLDAAAELWLWGLLFLAWTPWSPWSAALSLALALYAYRRALRAAEVYAALIQSAYDLHRFALYQALHWPPPKNPAEEHAAGEALTAYLWRGSDSPTPAFTGQEAKSKPDRFHIKGILPRNG